MRPATWRRRGTIEPLLNAAPILQKANHDLSVRFGDKRVGGPVVGIMAVKDDEQALALINDSDLGLTASLWTNESDVAARLADEIETGTVFMNRCDYLDPALPHPDPPEQYNLPGSSSS